MGCCWSKNEGEESPSRRPTVSSFESRSSVVQAQPEFEFSGSRRTTWNSHVTNQRPSTSRSSDGEDASIFTITQSSNNNNNQNATYRYDDLMPSFARSRTTTTSRSSDGEDASIFTITQSSNNNNNQNATYRYDDLMPSFARSQTTTTRQRIESSFTLDQYPHPLLTIPEAQIHPPLSITILKNMGCVDSSDLKLQLIDLDSGPEFNMVKNMFMKTTQSHYQVLRIEKIVNQWLEIMFYLKKQEYQLLYGAENVHEEWLFHGTRPDKVIKICQDNFNYRMSHPSSMHYGHGVYFTPISNYASHYHGQLPNDSEKPIFLVKVLYHRKCVGNSSMVVPKYYDRANFMRFDTAIKGNGHVWVKFDDDEYCPRYVIYYKGTRIPKPNIDSEV